MNLKIGTIIKRFRAERNITQDTLAAAIGVTPQAISRWESEGGYPDIEILPDEKGCPRAVLRRGAAEILQKKTVHVSISHDGGMALAFAVVETQSD